MKRWQMWTVAIVMAILIAGAAGTLYWYLTKEDVKETATVERTTEQKELDSVKKDLDNTDLDTADVDNAVKEIEAVDLSGV